MKIVLKTDYGFLTANILREYYKLKGIEAFFYFMKYGYGSNQDSEIYNLDVEFYSDSFLISKNYLGEKTCEKKIYSDENYLEHIDIDRTDLDLVKVIEILNPKNYKVIEIPDDIKYEIEECECSGRECVREVSRVWS